MRIFICDIWQNFQLQNNIQNKLNNSLKIWGAHVTNSKHFVLKCLVYTTSISCILPYRLQAFRSLRTCVNHDNVSGYNSTWCQTSLLKFSCSMLRTCLKLYVCSLFSTFKSSNFLMYAGLFSMRQNQNTTHIT